MSTPCVFVAVLCYLQQCLCLSVWPNLLCRESESGLINCFVDGIKGSLPFDVNSFEMRGGLQYGDLVIHFITH